MAKVDKKPLLIITGSEGAIGTTLRSALKSKYEIVGFDLNDTDCDIAIDLTSDASVNRAFKLFAAQYAARKIAAVIHLAAYFDFTGEDSPLYEKLNVAGTKRLLKALQKFPVERFIFTSTMLVHQPSVPGERINEKTPLQPKWVYPKSKLKAEKVLAENHGRIPYIILRLAGLYDDKTCVPTLANQITRIYEHKFKSHLYSGDVHAGQAFIHADDLILLFKKILDARKTLPKQEIILAGEPDTISYSSLQNKIGQHIHGKKLWRTLTVPPLLAKAGSWLENKAEPLVPDSFDQGEAPFIKPFMTEMASDHYALDISKAKRLLNWKPKHNILDALPKIVAALKKNPQAWYEKHQIESPDWMQTVKHKRTDAIREAYEKKLRTEHQHFLWAYFLNIGLGLWLISSPFTLGYQSQALTVSDTMSGLLLIFFGMFCLSWKFSIFRWVCAAIGVWLLFAPLIFWAPTAAAYLNDTLVGALIIGFSILSRPDVGVAPNAALMGPTIPPGWDFSPSNWFQRLPIITLAVVGLLISRYLTAYQLEHINGVWDPFFVGGASNPKNGTEEIITSSISQAWPIPDAGLGAVTYMLEILTGIIGGRDRWRTMPWLVLLFGLMIIPLGAISIFFIIIQPIILNTYCTLCLIAAASMLLQIPYSFDEIVATISFLWRRAKSGRPILKILFIGDVDEEDRKKNKESAIDDFEQTPKVILKEMLIGGVTITWNLSICMLIGIWLMLTPLTLGSTGNLAHANHVIGALVITIAITAFAEVTRSIRFLILFFAIALFVTPFVYEGSRLDLVINCLLAIALFICSLPKGQIKNHYGAWDKFIV